MGGLQWSESMSVGVPALDADHRCLVRIISLLENTQDGDTSQVVDTVLDTLGAYCCYHFAREEQVMVACDFPAFAFHRTEHGRFTRMVRLLRERHSTERDSGLAGELLDRLTAWLCHHILIQDMAYKPYVMDRWDGTLTLPEMPRLGSAFVGMASLAESTDL